MNTGGSRAAALALVLTARLASAGEAIAPPAGWEVPQAPTTASDKPDKKKKKAIAACCSYDQTCCSRQASIDAGANPSSVSRVVEVRFADLPEATVREAAEGQPPFDGAPPVRLINEDGQPFPWPKAPKQIRMLPPGPLGLIKWNMEWYSPSFDEKEFQGFGWGTVHYTNEKGQYTNDGEIAGNVAYVSIMQGEGDKLVYDEVNGKVAGSPAIKATFHIHAEAMHIVDQVVHGYRSVTKEKETSIAWVNFLLPQVIDGFESRDAKHDGGFFPSRFSNQTSYTLYRLPYGPGKSNMATFLMEDRDKRRWLNVSKKRPPKNWMRNVVVSASQTSVENEPRVSVMFFSDFTFD